MKLFRGPIAWRANKQGTTLSRSRVVSPITDSKGSYLHQQVVQSNDIRLNEPLIINYENTQTLRLITEDTAKLITKLRHVDIHRHWLRQEYAMRRVLFQWKATKEMIADGLTKALPK